MISQCMWCGKRYSVDPFSHGYCSEACRYAAAHKDDYKQETVSTTIINPNAPPSACLNLYRIRVSGKWFLNSTSEFTVSYGNIENIGKGTANKVRFAVYDNDPFTPIATYMFNGCLKPGYHFNGGVITLKLNKKISKNAEPNFCIEWADASTFDEFIGKNRLTVEFVQGEITPPAKVTTSASSSAPKTSTTSTSSSSSSSSSRTTTSSSSTKTTSGTSSSSTVTNTANKGKTKLSLDIGTFKVTGRVCEISYNKIKNNSPWESGTLRFALYYSNTNVIKDSVTVGRTYLGCSPEKDGLRVGNFYDKYSYKIDMSTDIPKGNYLLILLEEKDNSGKWNWRNGWASSTMSPF